MMRVFLFFMGILFMAQTVPAIDLTTGAIIYGANRILSGKKTPLPEEPGQAGRTNMDGALGPVLFETAFSPKGEARALIQSAIRGANRSILVATGLFTSKGIAQSLMNALKRGVKVMVISDAKVNSAAKSTAFGQGASVLGALASKGVPVRVNDRYGRMHGKFLVIDGKNLLLGSSDLSDIQLQENFENIVYLRNIPELAKLYAQEWKMLWDEGIEVKPLTR